MGLQLRRTSFKKVQLTVTLIAIFALVAQPLGTLLQSATALAASTSVVSPDAMNGWVAVDDNGHGGSANFVNTHGTLGQGSVELKVSASNQGYMLYKAAYGGTKLADISALSYDTYVQAGNNTIAPALQLDIDKNVTDGDTSWQGRLVYEPYQNGTATVTDGTWQGQDALQGKLWFSKPALFDNNCPQAAPCTFDAIKTLYANIGIRNVNGGGISFKAGSGWNVPFVGNVDNFKINDTIYDFEPASAVTGLGFTGSNTNSSTVEGCDVTTNKTSITAHWAAKGVKYNYRSWTTAPGSAYNSDATAYQVNNIGTNSLPGSLNQGEGNYFFKVQAVMANGDLSLWSASCKVTYDVTGPVAPVLLSPSNNAIVNGASLTNAWAPVGDAVKYVYESYNNSNLSSIRWTETTSATQKTAANVAHGTNFWWRVKAIDAQGNVGSWSNAWKVTIDNVAPTKPTLSLKATDSSAPIANGSATSKRFVTANWTQSTGVSSYEYQYWNNIAGNAYNGEANAYKVNVGMATSRDGEFNQGAGTHYIRVCALDAAMNRACSDTYAVTYYENEPALIGENFNTHRGTDYEGLNVGFRVNDFVDVTSVRVELRDADDNVIVRNEGTADLFALIKGGETQLSTPFVITPTNYPSDPYWNFNTTNYVWAYNSPTPVTAKVFVTGTNGAGVSTDREITLTNLANQEAVPFADLLPVYVPPVFQGGMGAGQSELVATQPQPQPAIVLSLFSVLTPSQQVLGATDIVDTDVLGAETKDAADDAAKTIAAVPTEEGWKLFGILWYWWLLLLAVIALITAWLVARARRNAEEQ